MPNVQTSPVAYLGPAGSWTHQASIDLFGAERLVPMTRKQLFDGYRSGETQFACVPVTTSVVGVTPYMDDVLDLPDVVVIAEYPKVLGYSLLARTGTKLEEIKEVFAHPVAFEEVKPWIDREMPGVKQTEATGGGAAAQAVANSTAADKASFGPKIGVSIYSLVSLLDGIEEGPHNVTRWWVLGRDMPAPTRNDKTSLLVPLSDAQFGPFVADLTQSGLQALAFYERPSKITLDTHRYVIEVVGHAKDSNIAGFLAAHPTVRVLGSYARKY